MSTRKAWSWLGVVCTGLVAAGCMPKMTLEEMKAHMPQRPAELDQLDVFVGKWQMEGEAKLAMLDEPVKMTGTGVYEWQGDRWYLVGHGTMQMADFDPCKGLETWSYDPKAKKFRSSWVDTMGMTGTGESTYNAKTKTWTMSMTSYGPWGPSHMKGTMCIKDPNTMEWTMTETQGLMKTMDMKGTSKRKP